LCRNMSNLEIVELRWIMASEFYIATNGKVYKALNFRDFGKTKKQRWYEIMMDGGETGWFPEYCFEIISRG